MIEGEQARGFQLLIGDLGRQAGVNPKTSLLSDWAQMMASVPQGTRDSNQAPHVSPL